MILVEGWIRMAAADVDRIRPAAVAMIEATRREGGCEAFTFAQDLADPELFRIVEFWTDDAALTAHFAAPHMLAFQQAMATITRKASSVKVYQVSLNRVLRSD